MATNQKQLHERLWAAAEQLRANGELKLNEIAEPILGLIFLKFADVKFRQAKKEIDNADFEARMKELMNEFTNLTKEAHELESKIQDDWSKIL